MLRQLGIHAQCVAAWHKFPAAAQQGRSVAQRDRSSEPWSLLLLCCSDARSSTVRTGNLPVPAEPAALAAHAAEH